MTNMIQQATAGSAVKTNDGKANMQIYIKQMQGEIKKALPSVITPERFTRIVLSALSTNPKLAQTTPQSFLAAMMTAAQLGVEPNTPLGQAYLIPYFNSKTRCSECQFQLGYKGLIDLAYRSGEVSMIQAQVVYENDEFSFSFGLEPALKHIPTHGDRGEPIYVYAIFRTKDGGCGFDVMSMDDIRSFAQQYSKSFGSGPWQTNFEEMAKKTVLKRVLKYAPLKSDFLRGIAQDETVKTDISEDMYAVPNTVIEVDGETGAIVEPEEMSNVRARKSCQCDCNGHCADRQAVGQGRTLEAVMSSRKIDVSIILSQNRAPSTRFWVLGAVIILTLVSFKIGDAS